LPEFERSLNGYLEVGVGPSECPLDVPEVTVEPRMRRVAAAETLVRMAELALQLKGTTERADRLLTRALKLDPGVARAHALLGLTRARQGRSQDAEQMFEQALRLEPTSAANRSDYGAYLRSRALSRADDYTPKASELSGPERASYLQRAREQLERAIALEPELPAAHAELALTYLAPGEPAERSLPPARRAFDLQPWA
jgi:Tfp pilus assembly protein PilF